MSNINILDWLMIAFIICYIVDVSGFVQVMKEKVFHLFFKKSEYKEYSLKPFDCSKCLCFWCGLAYIFYTGSFSLFSLFIVVLTSLMAEHISQLQFTIKDIVGGILNRISEKFDNL